MSDIAALAIARIKLILSDDVNYQTDMLKLGGIWNACMDAADYRASIDINGSGFVEVTKRERVPE